MRNSKLTLGSLFDGSGGFPLAGKLAGIEPRWASEIEPFPIRVTTKRLPQVRHLGDINAIDGGIIEPVDIITFGSPCTDMSIAGKRAGLGGRQSVLFHQAIRIIKEMRCATNGKQPRYIVFENVVGAFSSSGKRDFQAVLTEIVRVKNPEAPEVPMPEKEGWPLADVLMGDGWSVAYRTLDAQHFGVAQRRRRIYLVADFAGQSAGKVLFESEGVSGYSTARFRAWQDAARAAADCAGASGGIGGMSAGFCKEHSAKARGVGYEEEKAPTLRAGAIPAALTSCLNDQGGSRMDVTDNVTNTLRAQSQHPPLVFENHSQDSRYSGPMETSQTLTSMLGTGGNSTPLVVDDPKPRKIQSVCGEGNRALRYWDGGDVAGTLTANSAGGNQRMPDKENFHCVVETYGISSYESKGMMSDNPKAGIYRTDTSRTLDKSGGSPACHQGGVAIVEKSYSLQGSMIGRADKNDPQGDGVNEEVSFSLTAADRHAVYAMTTGEYTQVEEEKTPTIMARDYKDPTVVCRGIGRDAINQGKNAKFVPSIEEELQPPLIATGPGAVQRGYAVRRLTPSECALLQGFPPDWCSDLGTEKPTNADMEFWRDVFETYRKIMGTSKKPKTDRQIRKWLANPHADSAEYKMWGNGIALPCAWFVLAGIVHFAEEK